MRTWSSAVLLAAIAAVSSTGAVENERTVADTSFFSLVEDKMERASAMFERMVEGLSRAQEEPQEEEGIQVLVLDLSSMEEPFEEEDRQVACQVALKQLVHQHELNKEVESMHARLRSHLKPMFHIFRSAPVLDETCEDLGQVSMINECNRVLTMKEEIATWLQQPKSNEEICALVSQSTEGGMETVEANPLSCKLCKRFVQMVNTAIEQDLSQVEQVREIIGDLCDSMAADSMCHTFITRYDDIVAWLKSGTDPATVCLQLRMCPPADDEETAVVPYTADSHTCFYCVNINTIIHYVLNKAPTQQEAVHTVLKYGCTLVPENCKCSVLDENFDKIVEWLKQGKHPHEICESLQMCPKKSSPIASDVEPFVTNHDALEAVTALVMPTYALPSSNGTDGNECFYCDYMSTMVEVFMQEDAEDMNQVFQYANMICDLLGDANMCHQYITKMDFVVDALKKGKKPREICTALKYCAAKVDEKLAVTMAAAPMNAVVVADAVIDDSHQCFYCLHIVKVIRFVVDNTPGQLPKVQQLIKYGCKLAPKECKCELLDQNFDKIVELVKQHKHPFEICESVGSCKKEFQDDAKISKELVDVGVKANDEKTCVYCEIFTTLIEVAIQQDKDQMDEIRQYADMICGMLGDKNLCHQYVDKLDLVVDELKKGESARKICDDLKFCPAKQERLPTAIAHPRTSVNAFIDKSVESTPKGAGNIVEVE